MIAVCPKPVSRGNCLQPGASPLLVRNKDGLLEALPEAGVRGKTPRPFLLGIFLEQRGTQLLEGLSIQWKSKLTEDFQVPSKRGRQKQSPASPLDSGSILLGGVMK